MKFHEFHDFLISVGKPPNSLGLPGDAPPCYCPGHDFRDLKPFDCFSGDDGSRSVLDARLTPCDAAPLHAALTSNPGPGITPRSRRQLTELKNLKNKLHCKHL